MIQAQTRVRVEVPVRWMKAAERAETEGVRVCQLQATGQCIATSGTASGTAYEVEVTGNVADGCDCLAGLNGDPVCKHRAPFYLLIGALDLTPEPEPPALEASIDRPECNGCGVIYDKRLEQAGWLYPSFVTCHGTGITPLPTSHPTESDVQFIASFGRWNRNSPRCGHLRFAMV